MLDFNDQVKARLTKLDKFKGDGRRRLSEQVQPHARFECCERKDEFLKSQEVVSFAGRVVRFNRKR